MKGKDMKTTETWAKAINQRIDNGFESFIAFAMQKANLTREQAADAFAAFRKCKIVKIDMVCGTFSVKHGAFLESDVLRRAAGIEA